jgi:hypothetical protein
MSVPITPDADYLRNAELRELAKTLTDHRTRQLDVVASWPAARFAGGALALVGVDPIVSEEGVTTVDGLYVPTRIGDEGIAGQLDIPLRYLRRLREQHLTLLDENVNSWLSHESNAARKFLFRLLVNPVADPGSDGFDGVVRAVLSDSYKAIDNFDVLMASLDGIRAAGIEDPIITADLSTRRMVVRVTCPGVAVHAPELLKDYRNPFDDGERLLPGWSPERVAAAAGIEGMGYAPGTEPVVFAGFEITNSETGHGAFQITPRLDVRVCRNGLTISAKATREIHLGGKLDVGAVQWSDATRAANVALVRSQTADVVAKFVSVPFVASTVADLERDAGVPVRPSQAKDVIASVAKQTRWTDAEQSSILDHFMGGGQFSAGGIMQAASAAAQSLPADSAHEMEAAAVKVLAMAAAASPR